MVFIPLFPRSQCLKNLTKKGGQHDQGERITRSLKCSVIYIVEDEQGKRSEQEQAIDDPWNDKIWE